MTNQIAHPEWLVESDWLAAHLDDPRLRIFDCTTHFQARSGHRLPRRSGRAAIRKSIFRAPVSSTSKPTFPITKAPCALPAGVPPPSPRRRVS